MNIIGFLLPLALGLGAFFAVAFVVMAAKGQYDDLETPARRLLIDDESENVPMKGPKK